MQRVLIMSLILTIACGGSQPAQKASGDKQSVILPKPSAWLTPAMLAETLAIDAAAIQTDDDSDRYVSYRWAKADQEAIEKHNEDAMMAAIRARSNGEQNDPANAIPQLISTENHIALNYNPFDDADKADKAFDGHVARMRKGIEVAVKGEQHTVRLQYDQPVTDLGVKAAWSNSHNQLVFTKGRHLTFLTVNMNAAQNLANAKTLARAILDAR